MLILKKTVKPSQKQSKRVQASQTNLNLAQPSHKIFDPSQASSRKIPQKQNQIRTMTQVTDDANSNSQETRDYIEKPAKG